MEELENLDNFIGGSLTESERLAKMENDAGKLYHSSPEVLQFFKIDQTNDVNRILPASINDATVKGFKLFFHFDSKHGLLADEININSCLAYLDRLNLLVKKEQLKQFISLLSNISAENSWLFQSVSGLDDIWELAFSEVHKNQKITINTLETIDDKMKHLMMLYRKIVFDDVRGVWLVPKNLRQFSMSIYVYDYRMFSNDSSAKHFLNTHKNLDIQLVNHTLFDFGFCEFDNASGKETFSDVNNNASEFVTSSLIINTEQIVMNDVCATLGTESVEGKNLLLGALSNLNDLELVPKNLKDIDAWKRNLKENLQKRYNTNDWLDLGKEKYAFLTSNDTWRRTLGNVIESGLNLAQNKVENVISRIYLGNVKGFGIDDILRIGDSKNPLNDIVNGIQQQSHLASLRLDDDHIQNAGAMGSSINSSSVSLTLDDDRINLPGALGQI